MSSVTFGVVAMILVGISWIVWGYIAGIAPRRNLNMGLMVAASALGGTLISLPIALVQGVPDFSQSSNLMVMLLVLLGGIFNFSQLQFMSRAMKFGPNGIIWSIIQSGFIVPFAVGILFFGEPLKWPFALAVTLVIASLVIFAVAGDNESKGKWLVFTLLAFLATCACQSFQYIPSNIKGCENVSSIWRTLAFFIGLLLGFFINLAVSKDVRKEVGPLIRNKYTWLYALLVDVVEIIACYCFLYPGMDALAKSSIGAISTQLMTASGIVAFELYAVLLLKEKRTKWQVTALLLCLASIAVICF